MTVKKSVGIILAAAVAQHRKGETDVSVLRPLVQALAESNLTEAEITARFYDAFSLPAFAVKD